MFLNLTINFFSTYPLKMYKPIGYFVLTLLSFLLVSMIATLFTSSTERFVERNTNRNTPKTTRELLESIQKKVIKNSKRIKNQISNHHLLKASMNDGLNNFSNFFTRFNDDAAEDFSTSGLIMFNNNALSNKRALKDLIMKSVSKTYTPSQNTQTDTDDEENEIQYPVLEVIGFIFAKNKLYGVTGTSNTNMISKHLSIIQNEVADYFSLKNHESLLQRIEEELQYKNDSFFYNQLLKFRNDYLKKGKNQKNKDIIEFKDINRIRDDWYIYFPNYRNYTDIENKLKSKLGSFFEVLSELEDSL